MKRVMNVILLFVLVLSLAACGSNTASDSSGSKSSAVESPAPSPKVEGKGMVGDYEIEIKSAEKGKDYQKRDSIIVTYQFTNKSEKAQSFMIAISAKAFQDGIECTTAIDTGTDSSALMAEIKPGASIEVKEAYVLNNTTSPVEIEVKELITFTDTGMVKKTFTLE